MPKISSQTKSFSVPWNRFLAVLVTLIAEQLINVPKILSQDRTQQRTLEPISDTPAPQVVEELAEVFTHFSQDGVQQRFAEQIFEIPAIHSLTEKISEKVVSTLSGQSCEAQNHQDDSAKINHQDVLSRSMTITTNTMIMKQ